MHRRNGECWMVVDCIRRVHSPTKSLLSSRTEWTKATVIQTMSPAFVRDEEEESPCYGFILNQRFLKGLSHCKEILRRPEMHLTPLNDNVMAASLINGSMSSGALCDEILRRPEKHRTPLNDNVMATDVVNGFK